MNEWAVDILAVNADGTITLDFEEFLRVAANPFLTFTATEIADKDHVVNTKNKFVGRSIYDSTNDLPYWSTGTSPTDPWKTWSGTIVPS